MRPVFFLFYFSIGLWSMGQDTLKTSISLDTIGNEVYLITDIQGRPSKYLSPIFTPVCVDGSCYPIHISLYWDLAGNYIGYDLPPNEILTKIEHLPFTDFDYGLLHRMIQKSPSPLGDFSIYELTDDGPNVDGVSGATRPELVGNFVPDALFTTYTLWHLARKPSSELFDYTFSRYFNEKWTSYLFENPSLGCQEAIIDFLTSGYDGDSKMAILFNLIEHNEAVFPVEFLLNVPSEELETEYAKAEFTKLYQSTRNEKLKLSLLKIWSTRSIGEQELFAITNELGEDASCFAKELSLIERYPVWPEVAYEIFYAKIQCQKNMMRREKMISVLKSRSASFPKKFAKLVKKNSSFSNS